MIPIRNTVPREHISGVTMMLIALNTLAFLFERSLHPVQQDVLFYVYGLVPARYTQPELSSIEGLPSGFWPFLTSMFLHGGWMHVIGNMWSLWLFGGNVEDRMGHIRFLIFYLLCGVASAVVHLALNAASPLPLIGASGAVAGVMGAYFIMYPLSRIVAYVPIFIFLHRIEIPAFIYLGIWFLSQVYSGTMAQADARYLGGVAFWAHVGGFVMGVLLLHAFVRRRARESRWEY